MNESRPMPAPALMLMRSVALAALIVSVFLLAVYVMEQAAVSSKKLPFCSWASWLDCASVLSSPRYSRFAGLPVSGLAVLLCAAAVGALFAVKRGSVRSQHAREWFLLDVLAACITGAAVWFVYVQLAVMHRLCIYCLVDHALGLLLAFLIWLHGHDAAAERWRRFRAGAAGLMLVGVFITGQMMYTPSYTRRVAVMQGRAVIERADHPRLGSVEASKLLIEAIDYTCPRCANFARLYREASRSLGPDYGAVVLTFPLSHRCNPVYEETEKRHESACDLATLAHAVALANPDAFADFHDWLFEHQDEMTLDRARAEARRLVGDKPLEDAMPAAAQRVKRDVDLALKLGVQQLPGVILGDVALTALPEDAQTLALLIRAAHRPR